MLYSVVNPPLAMLFHLADIAGAFLLPRLLLGVAKYSEE